MLLDHDHVDNLRVLEGQEAETARAACNAVSHDCAFCDLAELCEVILQGLCMLVSVQWLRSAGAIVISLTVRGLPIEAADEHLAI